ncbi:hypothetical protein SAMN06265222_102455 [Neorhodopirellula lusitana]|uniref:Chromosome partition protein Smc n=1 Tax=Neorhodopirellula lusitana TaxID=445327 RepID=A0ABY1PVX5_9BACT|nr:hypothetical protein [Neorhodopirellula lusitana]SMP48807.1 hypothetical protein SAMN06265222_102455 [Neorhodopirellula lusitana]
MTLTISIEMPGHRGWSALKLLERLSEKVEDLQTRQLNQTVESLEQTLATMDELESIKTGQLRDAYPDQTESAPEEIRIHQETAIAAQQKALQKIDAALQAAPENETQESAAEARGEAVAEQLAAENAFAEMATAQFLADRPTDGTEKLIEMQIAASQLLATARANDQNALAAQEQIANLKNQLTKSRDAVKHRETEKNTISAQLAQRRSELQTAQENVESAKAKLKEETAAIAGKQAAQHAAAEAYNQARANAQNLQDDLKRIQRSSNKTEVSEAQSPMKPPPPGLRIDSLLMPLPATRASPTKASAQQASMKRDSVQQNSVQRNSMQQAWVQLTSAQLAWLPWLTSLSSEEPFGTSDT